MVVTNSSFSVESIARAYARDAVLCHLGVPIGDDLSGHGHPLARCGTSGSLPRPDMSRR
jgi:hypothetical protein